MSKDKKVYSETEHVDLAFSNPSPYGSKVEPSYSGALSFMRRRYQKDLADVDVAVVGVPFDLATTNRPGARFGPRAIREGSSIISWNKAWGWEQDPFEILKVVDYGDVLFDHGRPDLVPAMIEAEFRQILSHGSASLMLGGDHFSTYPVLKAQAELHGPLSLIHFDAHSDTWRDENGRIDHGTMFYHAAKEGIIIPEKSVQIGLRTHNGESHGFNIMDADWVHDHGADAVIKKTHEIVGNHPCYITFDVDCFDPAFAPGTGTPVTGGLTPPQVFKILRGLKGVCLKSMDVVEVAPAYDVSNITALIAATVAHNLLSIYATHHQSLHQT